MRRSLGLVLLAALSATWTAHAQISVQLTMERDTVLLFEAIPVVANVHNFSGHTIELANDNGSSWLSFLVSDEAGTTISPVRTQLMFDPIKIPPGRTVAVTANLLPHYDLRQRGMFTVRGLVDSGGARALSPPVRFVIINGREIWKQTIGLSVAAGRTNEEYRTYALLSRRSEHSDILYVSVQDEPHELVYGVIPLGESIAIGEPAALNDSAGHLHVLYRSGPRSHSYADVSPDGKVVKNAVYSDILSVPRLLIETDGTVVVRGGEQTYPHVERVMTDQELKPPPPPEKPPKKKWWWPFGPARPQAVTNSATATNTPPDNTWHGS